MPPCCCYATFLTDVEKTKWDSEAEKKIDIWADIAISIVLCSSCTDSDGISEHILDSKDDSCARIKRREAVKCREGRFTKVQGPPFSFLCYYCVTMKV